MSEAPKKLTGFELLNHAAELRDHDKAGGSVEFWHENMWSTIHGCTFKSDLWLYRKKQEPSFAFINVYESRDGSGRLMVASCHKSVTEADKRADPRRVSRIKVPLQRDVWDE